MLVTLLQFELSLLGKVRYKTLSPSESSASTVIIIIKTLYEASGFFLLVCLLPLGLFPRPRIQRA